MADMAQNRIRKPVNITLDPDLRAELDAWLEEQTHKIARAAWIETAVREQLKREKQNAKKRGGIGIA